MNANMYYKMLCHFNLKGCLVAATSLEFLLKQRGCLRLVKYLTGFKRKLINCGIFTPIKKPL